MPERPMPKIVNEMLKRRSTVDNFICIICLYIVYLYLNIYTMLLLINGETEPITLDEFIRVNVTEMEPDCKLEPEHIEAIVKLLPGETYDQYHWLVQRLS